MRTFSLILISSLWLSVLANPVIAAEQSAKPAERLAPIYRQTLVVTDLERSIALYRDALGLTLTQIKESPEDSYGNVFFNVPAGSQKRFAYFDGEDGRKNILGLSEMQGIDLDISDGPRTVAWVQTVADVEAVMEKVEALGLELLPPVEFISREAGKPGIETGVVDFDGHLIMFYGLKQEK